MDKRAKLINQWWGFCLEWRLQWQEATDNELRECNPNYWKA
jgi:hypothetical protein